MIKMAARAKNRKKKSLNDNYSNLTKLHRKIAEVSLCENSKI